MRDFYKDKNILIIGASSGLGKAICQELSKFEVKLYLTSRKVANLKIMENDVLNSKAFRIDINEEDGIRSLLNRIDDIDIIINLAGFDIFKPFSEINMKEVDTITKVNFKSNIVLFQHVLAYFSGNKSGIYVQINAFSGGKMAMPYFSVDCASRAAMTTLCKSLRREYADSNIKIVLFSPPGTNTESEQQRADIWEITGVKLADTKVVAREFLKQLAEGREDIILGSMLEKCFGYLDIISPSLADSLFYNEFSNKVRTYFIKQKENAENE